MMLELKYSKLNVFIFQIAQLWMLDNVGTGIRWSGHARSEYFLSLMLKQSHDFIARVVTAFEIYGDLLFNALLYSLCQ